ncbi:hypothetical protein SMGD1_0106 [Sulfurimonas gotlandica GD1]|jgi:hypothetical protein|uniref:Uncharacterized protein n=1 Tax=Sulfurimonas gotlandica (strain DSM 19862 / JCM 16533 / GD1) TaxID=929558 RepID=B6BLH6_SULGG|nr:hypothetical protein [Sulfurimonas gotlandica]EDZ62095.1 hypothetical protein CBGD1_2675 [Sulfurimonas gotlandica GD1]EHP28633.1 hypothetical protein SMGD1_0106 [Sulfurimonas gotlandica GD1]
MKLKTLFFFFLLSIFFLGTQGSATESPDKFVVTSEVSIEVSEQVEETEDNRNSLQPILLLSYVTLDSYVIVYDQSFFLRDNFIDIDKPPILKI